MSWRIVLLHVFQREKGVLAVVHRGDILPASFPLPLQRVPRLLIGQPKWTVDSLVRLINSVSRWCSMAFDSTVLNGVICPVCGAIEQADPMIYSHRNRWIVVFCRKCQKLWHKNVSELSRVSST